MIIKLRRGANVDWIQKNPVLADGEPGFEIDTGKFKIGDGFTSWSGLDYFFPSSVSWVESLNEHISSVSPHPIYDDGPSLVLLYENAKV